MTISANRDFLEFHDLPADAVLAIIERARALGEAWREGRMPRSLEGRRIALIVDDGGWRNTTAFDLGIQAMGGICVHAPVSLGGREAIADLAGYLDNWFDTIVVRTPELASLRELAARMPGRRSSMPGPDRTIRARRSETSPMSTAGGVGSRD